MCNLNQWPSKRKSIGNYFHGASAVLNAKEDAMRYVCDDINVCLSYRICCETDIVRSATQAAMPSLGQTKIHVLVLSESHSQSTSYKGSGQELLWQVSRGPDPFSQKHTPTYWSRSVTPPCCHQIAGRWPARLKDGLLRHVSHAHHTFLSMESPEAPMKPLEDAPPMIVQSNPPMS